MTIEEYIKKSFEHSYQETKENFDGHELTLKELYDFAEETSVKVCKLAIGLVYTSTAEAIRELYSDEIALKIADELILASEEFEDLLEEKIVDPLDEKYKEMEEDKPQEPISIEDFIESGDEDECLPF